MCQVVEVGAAGEERRRGGAAQPWVGRGWLPRGREARGQAWGRALGKGQLAGPFFRDDQALFKASPVPFPGVHCP